MSDRQNLNEFSTRRERRTSAPWPRASPAAAVSASDCIAQSIRAADAPAQQRSFIRRFDAQARATAAAVDSARASGAPVPRLAGLAVSIKDLFDIAGVPTTAASASLADAAPAAADCPAVQRLRQAGAALIGHTNLTEFAFSGVGINPHHGTPLNIGTLALDATARIPGGSTSGGAATVAGGAAWAAWVGHTRLDPRACGTARPGRLQEHPGADAQRRLFAAVVQLDTTCAITRSVRDAVLLHEVLSARRVQLPQRPLSALRLALPVG